MSLGRRKQIPLRDDEDDLVARGFEQLFVQENALALFEDLPGVEEKKHRVCPRDVPVGDVRALEREVVNAGCIDEDDSLFEERCWIPDLEIVDLRGSAAAAGREALHLVERHLAAQPPARNDE